MFSAQLGEATAENADGRETSAITGRSQVMHDTYICIYIYVYIYTYAVTYVIYKRRDVETQTFLALPRVVGFTFGFFGNDRAAPVDAALLILCTTYIHTSRIRICDSFWLHNA